MSIKDWLQEKGSQAIASFLKDIRIKSFHGFKVKVGTLKINPPTISVKSSGFKLKILDESRGGKAISEIPIPVDAKIEIPQIEIKVDKEIEINPDLSVKFKWKGGIKNVKI